MSLVRDGLELNFSVYAETKGAEVVCIIGDIPELGEWRTYAAKVLALTRVTDTGALWSKRIRVSTDKDFNYRYFVALVRESEETGDEKDVIVIRWETHAKPRSFKPAEYLENPASNSVNDAIFGTYDGSSKVDRGWLTCQTELRIRLHSRPLKWYKIRYQNCKIRIRCVPIDLHLEELRAIPEDEEDAGMDVLQSAMASNTLVSTMEEQGNIPTEQSVYGVPINDRSFITFFTQCLEPEYTGYRLIFYKEKSTQAPEMVGNAYLLPVILSQSLGKKTMAIIGSQMTPIGQISLEWLLIKPMPQNPCTMSVTYARYWRHTRQPLDVGHRGLGSSSKAAVFKELSAIRENTLASLNKAASHGADYVEFDVQLSKDKIPVIYHDFTVCLSMHKKGQQGMDWFQIGVNELNQDQLQLLRIDHNHVPSQTASGEAAHGSDELEEDAIENQPFPRLRDVFEHVHEGTGFNVEIKYPQILKATGELEEGLKYFMDRNEYVDRILREILEAASPKRRVIFSSFDPEVCSMLRCKQNKYPVMFLTQGETTRYPSFHDGRANCTPTACYFCESEGFLGVNAHTEDLLKNPAMITLAKERGLIVFCWGDDTDNKDTINHLKDLGVAAVIYDRINEFKETKENVYILEEQATQELVRRVSMNMPERSASFDFLLDNIGFQKLHQHELETLGIEVEEAPSPSASATQRQSLAIPAQNYTQPAGENEQEHMSDK